MPLFRRLPKRGFSNARFATTYIPVNVESLNAFEDGARVAEQQLREAGLANGKSSGGIKILGDGKLSKKLIVIADAFSAGARKQIEALGGTCEAPAAKAAKAA
jgi:large subunit ribosomal protein L15